MKRLEDQSDEALMVAYALGEYRAFQELYERHSGKVLGFLLKRISQTGEAEDLMQTVFLKLHQSRASYQPKFPFLAWLFSITRNTLTDYFRRKKAVPVEAEKLQALSDQSSTGIEELSEKDWKNAIAQLPESQRKVLEQRFSEGLSFEEISASTGISPVGARKRVSRAVQKLKEFIS